MAIIPDGMQFIGISPDIVLQEKKSSQVNGKSEPYTMTDIIDTVSAGIVTGADWGSITGVLSNQTDLQSALDAKQDDLVSGTNIKTINGNNVLGSGNLQITTTDQWGDITGTLSNQTDLQNALDDKVSKSDYTPAKSLLVQQSGTGSPSSLSVGQNTLIGRKNGGSSEIEDLDVTEVKDLLGYAEVNPTSTFLPINESDSFVDSPIFAEHPLGAEGFSSLKTKVNGVAIFPFDGIAGSPSWGLNVELNPDSAVERVQLGDFDNFTGTGKFEWSTGGNAPPNASYIKFDTYGQTHFESTVGYFKLDANVSNPALVDSALFDTYASGLYGFGRELDVNALGSYSGALWWNFNSGDFIIKDTFGFDVLYSNLMNGQTYIQSQNSKLGIEEQAMYISDDLENTFSVAVSHTKILNVRDASGNAYGIKLYPYN